MSRGFAFIDFPTVVLIKQVLLPYSPKLSCAVNKAVSSPQEAARRMMEATGENGLEIDGRNVFFQYRYTCFSI
jgi:RNA-binding protein 5/10